MIRNEKIKENKGDSDEYNDSNLNNQLNFSKSQSKIAKYLHECVKLIRKLSLEHKLSMNGISMSNFDINITECEDGLDLNRIITKNYILDCYLNMKESNILHILIEKVEKDTSKLYEEMIMEINEDHFGCEYVENKIIEMKEIDLYYSGYHITDIFKRSVIDKQVNKYHDDNSQEININWGNIGDSGLEYLCDFIYSMTNLHTINLYINNISNNGLFYLCKGLKCLKEMENINLGGNRISDKGVIELSNNFCYITKLKALYLMKNKIEDNGIIYLCNYLSLLNNLRILSVNHNYITNRGYKCLNERTVNISQFNLL